MQNSENQTYILPIPLKFDPTSPKPCITHVQTNFKPQTSVNQHLSIPKPTQLSEFSRFQRSIFEIGQFEVKVPFN